MGIIGGPDGPTAVFITTAPAGSAVPALLAVVVLGAALWIFLRKRKK
ncbi:MAG: LPXTG cell wall anchor domain-containing protein [Oscillibacter sp.]|nr:LPXTG cell wall anchor domain-containing protein [Oscillibacter sp.]